MPFSHHSHSGQFCAHARGSLREMVRVAIAKKMRVFALTEHMPRDHEVDLYPEEKDAAMTVHDLEHTFDAYYEEARSLQEEFGPQISILVGMEIDWIRPSSKDLIERIRAKHQLDFVVGSVHHVDGIPIDLDRETYRRAAERSKNRAGTGILQGDEEQLYVDYFDDQLAMLESVRPTVVGHFDLIRYRSQSPNASLKKSAAVWDRVLRNLAVVRDYGGFLEVNTSGLRKGLAEPYPTADICKTFASMGGRFVLSDDSHAVEQVGFGYADAMSYMKAIGVDRISTLTARTSTGRPQSLITSFESLISDLLKEPFFTSTSQAVADHQPSG